MTMDYKKKYENALEWARKVINGECGFIRKEVEEVFPELKESEYERIRKGMLQGFKDYGEPEYVWWEGVKVKECIAWLEKQNHDGKKWIYEDVYIKEKEQVYQDGVDDVLENPEKYGLVKKCEQKPKFKVGDWITNWQLTCKVLSVTSKSYELHLYNDDYCHFETDIQSVDKDYHLWSIEDAKDGDVLTSIGFHGNCTFIFNGLDNWKFDEPNGDRAVATGYCCLFVSADKMELGMQGPDCIEVDTVKPATKIQRDLLFQKMKEAGWSWNPETKELSQSKVTKKSDQEWSEEDKMTLEEAIEHCKSISCESSKCGAEHAQLREWLEELKQRREQKSAWSEEDEEQVSIITDIVKAHCGKLIDCRANLKWLKSLKQRMQ